MQIAAFLLALTVAVAAQSFPLKDEAAQQPAFLKFRTDLQDVVKRRDWNGLTPLLAGDIHYTFGRGRPGPKGFREFWSGPDRDLWKELGKVLERGGTFDQPDSFFAPYTYSCWPKGKDELEWGVLVGKNIPLYEKPDRKSRQYKGLSYWMLRRASAGGTAPGQDWVEVVMPREYQNALKVEAGYVETRYFAQPLDYRAGFTKKNGRWSMSVFVAGD